MNRSLTSLLVAGLLLAGTASAQFTFVQNFDKPNIFGNTFNEKNNPFGYTYTKVEGDTLAFETWTQPSDSAGPFPASLQNNGVTGKALNFTLGTVNLANPSGADVGGFGGGMNFFSGDTATTPPTPGTPKIDLGGGLDTWIVFDVATIGTGFNATIKGSDLTVEINLNDNTISQAIYNANDSQFVAETLVIKFPSQGDIVANNSWQRVYRKLSDGVWSFTNGRNADGSPITTTTVSGVARTPTSDELKAAFVKMVNGKRANGTTDAVPPTGPNLYSFVYNIDSGTASDFFVGAGVKFDNLGFMVPEPSTYAAIFGLIGLGYAVYRRRR